MPTPSTSPSRRSRALGAAVAGATALAALATGPAPAGAAAITPDAVGIRIDETAILGPVLDDVAADLDATVDALLAAGAATNPGIAGYGSVAVQADVTLDLDVRPPSGGPVRPAGSLTFDAAVTGLDITYTVPSGPCTVDVTATPATTSVDARVDVIAPGDPIPTGAPVTVPAGSSSWPASFGLSASAFPCLLAIDPTALGAWWDAFTDLSDPASTASLVQAALEDAVAALLDQTWDAHAGTLLNSLGATFPLTTTRLETDDHGLIVVAGADVTGGISLPGAGGPYAVAGAAASGATSDVNALLDDRTGPHGPREVITSVHPDVVNQYLAGLTTALGGVLATAPVPASIESVLIPPADRALYSDAGWTVRLAVSSAPEAHPSGPGGEPRVDLPALTLAFHNTSFGFGTAPVATFTGVTGPPAPLTGVDLVAAVAGGGDWVPGLDPAAATLDAVTRTQANVHAATVPAQPSSAIEPYALLALDAFAAGGWLPSTTLSPATVGAQPITLCTTCGRSTGDQRETVAFLVG